MKNYLILLSLFLLHCQSPNQELDSKRTESVNIEQEEIPKLNLSLEQANRLAKLPIKCINNPLPYKTGLVIAKASDLKMPIEHHPAFYGCFDWHSAVHGHWSLIYLLKKFPALDQSKEIRAAIHKNITKENILKEIEIFSLNDFTKNFERPYGWNWLLKLSEELYTWDDPDAKIWYEALKPLANHIAQAYITYLPKLLYPIRVGEHTNTGFGVSFAYDYALTIGDEALAGAIRKRALEFYKTDADCPISWEPSGYDFLSPCLQEMDIMRRVMEPAAFAKWLEAFLPELVTGTLKLEPGKVKDRSDGKLVHLDGVNFSRAWCLYGLGDAYPHAQKLAAKHMDYSLPRIADGDYAGEHWLASFALYAFKTAEER